MLLPPLACTVRGCHEPLRIRERSFVCSRGHSYDVARSGYINLLQPQDRKSSEAGDSREAVDARAELLECGVGRVAISAVVAHASALTHRHKCPVTVELGSGSGETLGLLAAARSICGVGIDLSTHAAALAARRFPSVTWVVANADRRLPLLDRRADLVLSVHARRNPSECHRILVEGGLLLVAIPAANDLIELREAVQGDRDERDRVPALIAEHDRDFTFVERTTTIQRMDLERDALLRLLRGTYRGERLSTSSRVQALDRLAITLASDIVLFTAR